MPSKTARTIISGLFLAFLSPIASAQTEQLSEDALRNIVERSYQYVAMYNVNNKGALQPGNPLGGEGWNQVFANTELADHTVTAIARPNNDTLYSGAYIDVTKEPMIMEIPAFDSTYVSLMVTGFDHYVNCPSSVATMDGSSSTRFSRPSLLGQHGTFSKNMSAKAFRSQPSSIRIHMEITGAAFAG